MEIIFYLILFLGVAWLFVFAMLSFSQFKAGDRFRGAVCACVATVPVLLAAILVAAGLHALHSKHSARRSKCMSNLSQIGKAMKMYSMDHGERFPDTLDQLVPAYVANTNIFFCPQSGQKKTGPLLKYIAVSNLSESNDYAVVQAYCPLGSHKGEGGNILFIDGSVTWMFSEHDSRYGAKYGPSFEQTIRNGRDGSPNNMPEDIGTNAPNLQH